MGSDFVANRFLGGSLFFPLRLSTRNHRVTLSKPGIFRQWERTIPFSQITCVSATTGLVTGTVCVESAGGAEDIIAAGFNRADIERFRIEVENAISL